MHHTAVKYAVRAAGSGTAVVASPEEGAVLHVGSGQPVKAFQVALKSMKQGEKASLKIKPECKLSCPLSGLSTTFMQPSVSSTVRLFHHLWPPGSLSVPGTSVLTPLCKVQGTGKFVWMGLSSVQTALPPHKKASRKVLRWRLTWSLSPSARQADLCCPLKGF